MSHPKAAAHLQDDVLICLLSDELSIDESQQPKEHLATCWTCRARYEQLERVALSIAMFSKEKAGPDSEPTGDDDPFFPRLRQAIRDTFGGPWWTRVLPNFQVRVMWLMNPVAATALVVACAAVVLLYVWQRNLPTVTASELMNRAVAADTHRSQLAESGVAYQSIRVRTQAGIFDHAVYRDVTGRRRARPAHTDKMRQLYEAKLAVAGVLWDQPLSAATFKTWHDEQKNTKDEVKRSGNGLLTLTTKVSDGIVSEESLTVRADTFHPVERTVDFVDIGPVDFLELNYDVLSWNAVNADLFEPLPALLVPTHPALHAAPAPAPLIPLTNGQLDEAELQARLVLNELNADSSERLQVARNAMVVEVTGIVPTNERKLELQAGLEALPHVSTSISSFEDAKTLPVGAPEITSVQSASVVAEPPLLVTYLLAHGQSPEESARFSQQLFNAAVTAQQEAKAITDLTARFAGGETLTENGTMAFRELLVRHQASLLAALDDEERVLTQTGVRGSPGQPLSTAPRTDVNGVSVAENNLRLCKELTSGSGDAAQTVEQDVPEILDSVVRLRAFAQAPLKFASPLNQAKSRREP